MSGVESSGPGTTAGTGRYCYCLVSVPEAASTGDRLEVEGVGGGDPYLVVADGVGAVVQEQGEPFESDDEEVVAGWLVRHQSVVDRAGERYGTPLPFRFDVVLAGGDADVADWIRSRTETVTDRLEVFAGTWEYRVQLLWDGDPEPDLRGRDDRLEELWTRRERESGGTAFLVKKQYEQRLREVRSRRRDELLAELEAAVESVAVRTTHQDQSPVVGDREPLARLAVLAAEDEERRLGDCLEAVADGPTVKVRFTGPWPPYSFAPSFEEGD